MISQPKKNELSERSNSLRITHSKKPQGNVLGANSKTHVTAATVKKPQYYKVDIGIVGNCVENKFKKFVKRHNRNFKTPEMYRFIILNYGCTYDMPSKIGNVVLVSHNTRSNFSRSANINSCLHLLIVTIFLQL